MTQVLVNLPELCTDDREIDYRIHPRIFGQHAKPDSAGVRPLEDGRAERATLELAVVQTRVLQRQS